ncbi:MAG: tetratricopeptide repeat protein [Bdellovibrionia bacterium]
MQTPQTLTPSRRPTLFHGLNLALGLLLCFFMLSGCLKTRAQLKEDSRELASYPTLTAPPVQEVKEQSALEDIKEAVASLDSRVQELESSLKDPKNILTHPEEQKKWETRLQHLEQQLTQLEQTQNSLTTSLQALENHPSLFQPEETYAQAKKAFESGQFSSAAETWSHYLKMTKAKKIEEATFMRATCYFNLKQFKKAIVDYSQFPEKYPKSPRTPKALYQIALSFDALEMKDDARGFYQELLDKYPGSPEAKKAKKKAK